MDLRTLRAFVEVVRRNGFSAASREIFASQPTVSKAVRQLEDELGLDLLHRLPQGVRPTEAGEVVLRHAQAHTVEIALEVQGGELCLRVSDDGRGFDPQAQRAQSFGLVGMQERMLMLGGQLQIDSQPGEGTTLCARINLEEEIAA